MNSLFRAITSPLSRTKNIHFISLAAATLILIIVLAQLFSFEDFPGVLGDMRLPGGELGWSILAAIIVTLEVLSLPFLLFMQLSPFVRIASMVASWLVALFWLLLAVWSVTTSQAISNVGILGETISFLSGWWSVLFAVMLGILVGWASWGMWPLRKQHGID